MKKYANVLSVAILAGLAVGASAQGRPVQRMTEGREVQVLAYAPIDAEGRIIGAWQQSSVFDFSPNYIAFDNYEAAPGGTGAPDEFRLPNFGEGNNRYWFGDGYKSCFVINDFTVVSGYAAGAAKRANFAFAQTAAGAEAVFVQIRTYETFTGINSPPGATGFLSGFVASLGSIAPSTTVYNFGNLTLTGADAWTLPADGSGAYEIKYLRQLSPETQCTEAQPMYWLIKPGQFNAGAQGPLEWDDDAPANNVHAADELYDYFQPDPFPDLNTTLEPLGAMLAFYADYPITSCPITVNLLVGTDEVGGPGDLCASDNNYYSAFNDPATLTAVFEVIGDVPNQVPSTLVLNVEASVGRPGLQQQIAMFKYATTNAYVTVNGSIASQTDSTLSVTRTTDAKDFVNASTGQVKVRFTWSPLLDEQPAFDGWLHNLDVVTWNAF